MASGDEIGAAVIRVDADASGLSAGIAQATQAVKNFAQTANQEGRKAGEGLAASSTRATAEALKLSREQERLTTQIERYAQTVGRTRGEVLEARAQALGLGQAMQSQLASIRATEAALKTQTTTLNAYGITAKQQAASLRGVPAQITDIFVGLQGGQNPLTVLLQQGGQLKDMFGGIVPAARALGGALVALINPYTILAGLFAVVTLAYFRGASEAQKFNEALITTGNSSGRTANQLAEMAQRIDGVIGTQAQASQALTALASTGVVAGSDLERFATTAIRLQKTLGVSVSDTAKQFADLAKDPVRASERLNEATNYLTLDIYRQITALQDAGRETEAGEAAQRAYATAMDQRTAALQDNFGIIERGWKGIKGFAAEAWDAMLGIGRTETLSSVLERETARLDALRNNAGAAALSNRPLVGGGGLSGLQQQEERVRNLRQGQASQNRFAAEQAGRQRREKESIEAESRLNALTKSTASNAEKRAREIAAMRRDAELTGLSLEKQNALEKAINEKYKDPARRKPAAVQDTEATRYLLRLREINAALTAQTATEDKLTEADKERARFVQQIADLKEKKVLTADQKSLLAAEEAILKQLDLNVAVNAQVRAREESEKALKREQAALERYANSIEAIQIAIGNAAEGRQDQRTRQLGAFGRGDRAREELEAQRQLNREYEKYEAQILKNAARNNIDPNSERVQKDLAEVRKAREAELAAQQDYFKQLLALQGDWLNGATRALENYYESTRNIAGQVEEIFTNAFKGAEDALVDFFKTGKLDATSFLESLQADILRTVVRTQITGPLSQAAQGNIEGGGILKTLLDGFFGSETRNGGGAAETGAGAGLLAVASGSSAAVAALTALAAAASSASVSMGGSSLASAAGGASSGGFWSTALGWAGSLFGRASGGFAGAGNAYNVNENGPEMLTVGNRSVLMMGNQSGNITPMRSGGSTIVQNNRFIMQGPVDRRTENQVVKAASRGLQRGQRNL